MGLRGRRVILALLGLKAWQESPALLASLGPLGLDCLGLQGTQVGHQAPKETRAALGLRERKDLVVDLASQGCLG